LTGIAYALRTASTFAAFVKSISAAAAIWRRKVHERKCEHQTSTTLPQMPDRSATADELEVVVKAKNGSSSAVEQLVDRYKGRIFRVAQKITSNREDAEEVVQNVFLKAFRSLANFRGDSRFYTWLVRIAINESLMKVRGRRPQNISINDVSEDEDRAVLGDLADAGPNPEEQYSHEELRSILSMAMAELGPGCRVVIQLRDIEGLTTEETARTLNLSVSAVKTRLRRARLHLRESLNVRFRLIKACDNLGTMGKDIRRLREWLPNRSLLSEQPILNRPLPAPAETFGRTNRRPASASKSCRSRMVLPRWITKHSQARSPSLGLSHRIPRFFSAQL
jgi:RNA polymerase sigma-70 factor (ECF subfamily)